MKHLYKNNSIMFSIFLIIIYLIGNIIILNLISNPLVNIVVLLIYNILLVVIIGLFIIKNKLFNETGFIKPILSNKRMLYYIPLISIILIEIFLLLNNFKNHNITFSIIPVIMNLITVGIIEEIIFRSFLYKAMLNEKVKGALLISSLTFGIGHIFNLFNPDAVFTSVLIQIICATSFGFLFSVILLQTNSIIPCILTHAVINGINFISFPSTNLVIICELIVGLIALVYGIYLYKILKKGNNYV